MSKDKAKVDKPAKIEVEHDPDKWVVPQMPVTTEKATGAKKESKGDE